MSVTRSHLYAEQSWPGRNRNFDRLWSERPFTARELELAADVAQAHGNNVRASLLSWRAHQLRVEREARR